MSNVLKFPFRYKVLAATFLLSLLLYIDRIAISTAKDGIAADLQLSDVQIGWTLSVFALGYALFQVPGGMLGDRLGARKTLSLIVSFWSVFTGLTGMAWNYISLMIARFLFGAGEAGAYPCISRTVYSWFPLKERGIVNGINFSGSRVGAAFSLPVIAWLIDATGWRISFFILGIIGFAWAIIWYVWFRDEPEHHASLPAAEKQFILSNRQQKKAVAVKIPLSKIFASGNTWLAMGQYFASNFVFFFCLTWLYPYLRAKYNLSGTATGLYAMMPLLMGAVGNWTSGALVDFIYKKGYWKLSRRLPAVIGFILTAAGLLLMVNSSSAAGAVTGLSIAVFGADMTLSPSWTFCTDIGKESAGTVSGVMNMAGNIGSFITALCFPYLKKWTGSDTPFFYTAMVLALVAAVLWLFMDPEKELAV